MENARHVWLMADRDPECTRRLFCPLVSPAVRGTAAAAVWINDAHVPVVAIRASVCGVPGFGAACGSCRLAHRRLPSRWTLPPSVGAGARIYSPRGP
jgi:hypothetical protein